jgi:hypothetical protein
MLLLTIPDVLLLIRRLDDLVSHKTPIILLLIMALPPGNSPVIIIILLRIASPTSQTRPRAAHPAGPPAVCHGTPRGLWRCRFHARLGIAGCVFEGEGMEFILVFLVPRVAVLGAGDLAGFVVFDVGTLGRGGVVVAFGFAAAAAAFEDLSHLGAE